MCDVKSRHEVGRQNLIAHGHVQKSIHLAIAMVARRPLTIAAINHKVVDSQCVRHGTWQTEWPEIVICCVDRPDQGDYPKACRKLCSSLENTFCLNMHGCPALSTPVWSSCIYLWYYTEIKCISLPAPSPGNEAITHHTCKYVQTRVQITVTKLAWARATELSYF